MTAREAERLGRGGRGAWRELLTPPEWTRLGGFTAGIVALHILGLGLYAYYARSTPALAGLASLAYAFGLRHAFDADHIAAIDNVTRRLLQDGRRPLGTGFFFSLGHSSIVLVLTAVLGVATRSVSPRIPGLQEVGGSIGAAVSGSFLLLIGILNLLVLLDLLGVFRRMRRGQYDAATLERALLGQGLMNRLFLRRVASRIDTSWKMYPLGVLFGLGFDTATEIAVLGLAAGVATQTVPFLAAISLPLIFAAGMTLMDTADGVFMSKAYGWAFSSPMRKVYYNITVTSVTVTVALVIGGVELLQVAAARLSLEGGAWDTLGALDLGRLGYATVAFFVLAWLVSVAVWKARRIDERWGGLLDRQ